LTHNIYRISERNSEAIEQIVQDLRVVTSEIRGMVGENRTPLKNALSNLEKVSEELDKIAKENRTPLRETVANLQGLSSDLRESAPKVMNKIDKIVERLERGEGTVGKLMKEEGFYEKLDSTLAGINKYVTATERFKLNVGFRGEYLIEEDDTKGYFSLKLQPREDKYYLFEIVDDPRGRVRVTNTELTTIPGSTVITKEVKRENQLKFSALFGRRFGNVGVRGGLMEDTFGFGADYYIANDRFKASFDAWNFKGDEDAGNPHLKLTASYTIFKNLFIDGGVDDFVNSKRSSSFAGAGLTFDDEDLKYILTRLPISLP